MPEKVFPQMNTFVRLYEGTLLSDLQKAELLNAHDADDAFKALISAEIFAAEQPKSLSQLGSALEAEKAYWLAWAKEISPESDVADIFILSDEVQNIRIFIKENVLNKDLTELYSAGTACGKATLSELMNPDAKKSPRNISVKSVIDDALADYGIHNSLSRVDIHVRIFYHTELISLARKTADESILSVIRARIDLDYLSLLLQMREGSFALNSSLLDKITGGALYAEDIRRMFCAANAEQDAFFSTTPYSGLWFALKHQGGGELFEVYADNYLLSQCRKAKLEAFGLFPLFAFLYAKLLDITNIRVLFAAKRAGAGTAEISERLRDSYEI